MGVITAAGVAAAVVLIVSGAFGSIRDVVVREAETRLLGVEKSEYRVDAIFDTARGLLPGQLVKVAGARVGRIEDVVLTPDNKARVQMHVVERFRPFRADASCSIQPEGLIGERFVQCEPGDPRKPELRARGEHPPTVPVQRTRQPFGLQELFELLDRPAQERIALVIAGLGIGNAGRGEDVNAIIRRANPTLAATRELLDVIERDKRALTSTLTATDRTLAELGRRPARLRSFIRDAAAVTRETGRRQGRLDEGVRRLPALLAEAEPALRRLDSIADDALPLVRNLRTAAPDLETLLRRAGPFARAALPVVDELRTQTPRLRSALRAARPTAKQLRTFAGIALPVGRDLRALSESLRDRGFNEGLLTTIYRVTAANSRFDAISHLFPLLLSIQPHCPRLMADPLEGCDQRYDKSRPSQPHRAKRRGATRRRAAARRPAARAPARPAPQDAAPDRPPAPRPAAPGVPPAVEQVLDFLLR